MEQPLVVDIPHRLGAEEARRRIARGMGRLSEQVPGGAKVETAWTGNRLDLSAEAMGQRVRAAIEVGEDTVRVELMLPPGLGFFARAIEAAIRRKGAAMLEDRSRPA